MIFGYVVSISTFVSIITSYAIGKILDVDENLYKYIFMIIGALGCVSSLIMAMIKIDKKDKYNSKKLTLKEIIFEPIKRGTEVLKENRDFAIFQRNFFIYGAAFMLLLPAIPTYLVDSLGMSYTQTFIAKAVVASLGILLLSPFAGKIHDKKNPAFFTTLAFATLSLYPLILFISSKMLDSIYVNYIVYFAFFIYGIAMSAMVISWNISSIYFAGSEDVSMYQSVHVTLTGLRGLIMPFFGFFILKYFGMSVVFIVAFIIFLFAAFLSYRLYLQIDRR